MSGFFFCGMMLDPVDQESCSVTKPNSRVAQRMTSSANRLTSMPIIAVTNANSATKSREAVPSIEFGAGAGEAELGGHRLGVEAEALPGQRARAVRRVPGDAGVPVVQPLEVADQRPGVGQQVVAEQHRLGVLQVRAAGHDRAEVPLGLGLQRLDQVEDQVGDHPGVVAQVDLEQRGHLVVAGPAGAQPATDVRADLLEQQPLQGAVHVLVAGARAAATRRRTAPPARRGRGAARRGRPR